MPNKARTPMTTRSIVVNDAVTTISLEDPFWQQLEEVAKEHDLTVAELISLVEDSLGEKSTLAAAPRTFVAVSRVRH